MAPGTCCFSVSAYNTPRFVSFLFASSVPHGGFRLVAAACSGQRIGSTVAGGTGGASTRRWLGAGGGLFAAEREAADIRRVTTTARRGGNPRTIRSLFEKKLKKKKYSLDVNCVVYYVLAESLPDPRVRGGAKYGLTFVHPDLISTTTTT